MGKNSWQLVREVLSRINYFRFQRNLVPYVLAKLYLADLPDALSHKASPEHAPV